MRIDDLLTEIHHAERHAIHVDAPAHVVYPLARHLDFNESWITRTLFRLRGLPSEDLRLDAMLGAADEPGFAVLDERPDEEFVIGALSRGIQPMAVGDAEGFPTRGEAPGLRIVWNFHVAPDGDGCEVTTITRVQCMGAATRLLFGAYWLVVGPISGWIRREMLPLLTEQAEAAGPRQG